MTEHPQILAQSQAAEAANASAISKEADLKAQASQMESVVINAMRQVFGPLQTRTEEDQMHILLPKIPLLCLNVEKMGEDIKAINENIKWGVRIVIGAVLVALVGLIVKSQI